jgi:hypothetical protein
MKIQSHEIAMQSQHLAYKSIEESKMSFSTFYDTSPIQEKNDYNVEKFKEPDLDLFCNNKIKTISEIIQSLLNILKSRIDNIDNDNDEVKNYTHLSFYERYEEHESLEFSTLGHIQTDSGSFDIDLNFSMSRNFIVENRIDIYTAFDPLIINLCGDIPTLSSESFSFDLDNDGESDQISKLGKDSGFLVFDKNGDGKINQGSELFGTLSGDGFGELGVYDEDSNHWIDENDSIFDKLQIWLKNDDDNTKELVGLGEVGIGAIFLDSSESEFRYKTQKNQTLGEMKSCGIFLKENGVCGNISQIDLSTHDIGIDEVKPANEQHLASLLQA